MNLYTCLSKSLYNDFLFSRVAAAFGLVLGLGGYIWFFHDGIDLLPFLFSLPFLAFYLFLCITPLLPSVASIFGKRILIEENRICIYTHKKELLNSYPVESLNASLKVIKFSSAYRAVPIDRSCIILHVDPDLFAGEDVPLTFEEIQRKEDTFVIQNPEAMALLEQIFTTEKK